MTGPSFILFTYCLTFLFSSPESASRQAFLILIIMILIPMIIGIILGDDPVPKALQWIYAFFPPIGIYQIFNAILIRVGMIKATLSFYFKEYPAQPHLIMQIVDIFIYGGILFSIEIIRTIIQKMATQSTFGSYGDFFKKQKAKHPVTDEAHQMEGEVAKKP